MTNGIVEVFFGSYTSGSEGGPGIRRSTFDPATGELGPAEAVAEAVHPSWLLFSADGRLLYTVNETEEFSGEAGGSVTVFRLRRDGSLRRSSTVASGGVAPCHLSLSRDGHLLLCANYGGTLAVLPLDASGLPSPAAQLFAHAGEGPVADRQASAHPHSVVPAPDGRFVHVPDLGSDRIETYEKLGDRLEPRPDLRVEVAPGSGPRHLTWHPDGHSVYVVCELSSRLLHLVPDSGGALRAVGELPTAPGAVADTWPAEVSVHPAGHTLYVSNRGHDSLGVFRLGGDGTPEFTGEVPAGVRFPRHFAVSPCGGWLLAAGQHDGRISVLRVTADGGLQLTDSGTDVPAAASVAFRPGVPSSG